jgi:hypothetical protein
MFLCLCSKGTNGFFKRSKKFRVNWTDASHTRGLILTHCVPFTCPKTTFVHPSEAYQDYAEPQETNTWLSRLWWVDFTAWWFHRLKIFNLADFTGAACVPCCSYFIFLLLVHVHNVLKFVALHCRLLKIWNCNN